MGPKSWDFDGWLVLDKQHDGYRCTRCKEVAVVDKYSGNSWLNGWWRCPYCGHEVTTEGLHKEKI